LLFCSSPQVPRLLQNASAVNTKVPILLGICKDEVRWRFSEVQHTARLTDVGFGAGHSVWRLDSDRRDAHAQPRVDERFFVRGVLSSIDAAAAVLTWRA
jgi:hypothetical protein